MGFCPVAEELAVVGGGEFEDGLGVGWEDGIDLLGGFKTGAVKLEGIGCLGEVADGDAFIKRAPSQPEVPSFWMGETGRGSEPKFGRSRPSIDESVRIVF